MKHIHLFLLFFIFNAGVYSQWSTDPSENTPVTSGGLLPHMITDGAGGAFIVYQDSPTLLRQLWVQRLDRFGYVRFPDNGIRLSSANRYQSPYYHLVSDSSGGVIVLFEELHGDENSAENYKAIYAQRIDSSGAKLWGDAGVALSPFIDGKQKAAISACSDGENGAFVFWSEDADSNGVYELRAQRITADGQFTWPDSGVVVTDKFVFDNISWPNPAVSDGADNAIILYSENSWEVSKLQKLNGEGEFLWGEGVDIYSLGRQMISDNRGGAIIAGVRREFDSVGVKYILRVQRVDRTKQIQWGEKGIELVSPLQKKPQEPRMTLDKGNHFFCVWSDKRTGSLDVYLQRLDIHGTTSFEKGGVPVSQISSDKGNAFVLNNDVNVTVIFGDNREPNGFYAQKVDSSGLRVWNEDDVLLCDRNARPSLQAISNMSGGAIICWYEIGAGSGWGIFAQQVSRNGNLGEVLLTSVPEPSESSIASRYFLHQSYPNPFNAEMIIKYKIPENNHVTLIIYDITRKEVIALINKNQAPGVYQVKWNGKNSKGDEVASGIYIYQLCAGNFVESKKAIYVK